MSITIGTDCSGIEAPIEALKQLGIPFVHKWACEKDKFARMSIMANNEPEVMYTDITQRDHSQLPDVDLYVCGFPCQPFSSMGNKKGTKDPRGNIMLHCIDVIKTKQPPVFILENVKNFKNVEQGKPFELLMNALTSIVNQDNECVYNVICDVYNTKHYGIPQNRERLYIIGIKHEIAVNDFVKPPTMPIHDISEYMEDNVPRLNITWKSIERNRAKASDKTVIITPFKYYSAPQNVCPTLTTCCSKYYHIHQERFLTPRECLNLQGFQSFNQVVSNTQLYKQAGNSMSVNVLKLIILQIIQATILEYIII